MSHVPQRAASSEKSTAWEKAARTRWGSYITEIEREALLKASSLAGSPTLAVDYGCEGGRWSQLLSTLGWKLICADVAQGPLRLCRDRLPAACCLLVGESATAIPSAALSIGLISCIEVPDVITGDWFVEELARVLKPKGVLVGTFFNRWSIRGFAGHLTSPIRRTLDYYQRPYVPWRRELTRRGFRMIDEVGCCWLPFRRQSNSALIPVLTRLEKAVGLRKLPAASPWIVFVAQKPG